MSNWMLLWITLLVAGAFGMVGLLLTVTVGAVSELRQTLAELKESKLESADSAQSE